MSRDLIGNRYSGNYVNAKFDDASNAEYTFPNGSRYIGGFRNGVFHGEGQIILAKKGVYKGVWENGKLVHGSYAFDDGLIYDESREWDYCTDSDRRYYEEREGSIAPANATLVRNQKSSQHPIPPKTYDTVDGYFDPETGHVHDYETNEILRTPSVDEATLIKQRAYYCFEETKKEE